MRHFIVLFLFLPCISFGQIVHEFLQSKMDGTFTMSSGHVTNFWGYGYQSTNPNARVLLPGPTLRYSKNDSVDIHFFNNSPEDHTIHLHGLDVSQVNDGVPSTSFAVGNQDSVNYRFRALFPGTYLYHCHVLTTLHLTMGMYGLVVVDNGDNRLYDGGPKYNREFNYLTSDLKQAINDNPLSPGALFHVYPDYFMINGKADQQIYDDTTISINYALEDTIALRLANIGYSCNKYIFPAEFEVKVFQSDGRELPNSFLADTLMLYPGERYTAIGIPQGVFSDTIFVEYCNMSDGAIGGVNKIPIRLDPKYLSEDEQLLANAQPLRIFPNPSNEFFHLFVEEKNELLQIFNLNGQRILTNILKSGMQSIDISHLPEGMYFVQLGSRRARLVVMH